MCDEDTMPHFNTMTDVAIARSRGEPTAPHFEEPDVDVIFKGKLVGRVFARDAYGNKPSQIEHPKLGRLRVIAFAKPKRTLGGCDLPPFDEAHLIERGIATVEKDGDDGMMHELWRLH